MLEYEYDARKRLDEWKLDTVGKDYDYDSRGSMILDAGDPGPSGPQPLSPPMRFRLARRGAIRVPVRRIG